MPLPLDQARNLLESLSEGVIPNRIAQANARQVLYEVGELRENFPDFDPGLTEKITYIAYAQLAAGCSLREAGVAREGADALEQAAALLAAVHRPHIKDFPESGFHAFIASLAFYAAGQYSRAFVTMREIDPPTSAAGVIAAFLRKDARDLITRLNETFLGGEPTIEDQDGLDQWLFTLTISRALGLALEFTLGGDAAHLEEADRHLEDGITVAAADSHAGWWWILRLLRLMLRDLSEASPWTVLPPYFGPHADGLRRYIQLHALAKRPFVELWRSQRVALPLGLETSRTGAVVNLRTGAGKTRIAELAALRALLDDPSARVLYLAPFRSLALEVEQSFSATFPPLGFAVSHLYGGARVSSIDTELASDSSVVIATPEKARALFRAAPEVFDPVKLIVIDEGHLVGMSGRYVPNELFVDHLRQLAKRNGARILLLSAVLPNPQQLAEWITGDPGDVASSPWKPASERFGLLRWDGSRARIEWQGPQKSFNPSFVEARPLGWGTRRKPFPSNKNEAVAASAVRLTGIGPVMIFTGRATSVPGLAKAVLIALGQSPPAHPWPTAEWRVFEDACTEELETDAIELYAARAGIICHSNRLTPLVRQAMEHLMRAAPPKVIVATTTLAQGVNVGVSSVIVANPYYSDKTISRRDFWNICGRAGRAFVDGEGKVLYAIDATRDTRQIRRDEQLARDYFAAAGTDPVESGLLAVACELRRIGDAAGVDFERLLELVANGDFTPCGTEQGRCEEICDFLDDGLLALHEDASINPLGDAPEEWVDRAFRQSLAVIQARDVRSATSVDEVLRLLKARAKGIVDSLPDEPARKAMVACGLPLRVARRMHKALDEFRSISDVVIADTSHEALSRCVSQCEDWLRANGESLQPKLPDREVLDALRAGWLNGTSLRALTDAVPDAPDVCRDLYGYHLPWIVHAAAQQLRRAGEEGRATALERVALLIELGVPNERAARIFLAGVRSRGAAVEIASVAGGLGETTTEVTWSLRAPDVAKRIAKRVSARTASWLALLASGAEGDGARLPAIDNLTGPEGEDRSTLHVRKRENRTCICRSDGSVVEEVDEAVHQQLVSVANDPRLVLARVDGVWQLLARDPRLHVGGEG